MNGIVSRLALIGAILTFAAGIVFADDLAVKPESPPGQEKKNDAIKEKTNPATDKVIGKPEAKPKEVTEFLTEKVKTNEMVKTRLGSLKLKDVLKSASVSGDFTTGGQKVRVREMVRVEATPGAMMKRHAISGVITGLGDNRIIITHQTQKDRINTVYYNTSTLIKIKDIPTATAADLAIGQRIAASGTIVDGTLLANRIHAIPGKATGLMENHPVATSGSDLDTAPTPASAIVTTTPAASPSATPTVEVTATPEASPTAIPES